MSRRIVIVGGVATGASAAAKARRTSEDVEIVVIEAGPYVSLRQLRPAVLRRQRGL